MSQKVIISIKRLVPALIIGPASWLGPYIVMLGLFLPALLQELDAENKVAMLALFAATGSIISAISNMVAGALMMLPVTRIRASASARRGLSAVPSFSCSR